MRRLVFIVSAQRQDLYDGLRKALEKERGVELVLDRRVIQRRRRPEPPPGLERRRADRREHVALDLEIRDYGWTVVKVVT